jgi:hypothetical protein
VAARRDQTLAALPYRGSFGTPRPGALAGLPLPPEVMPSHDGFRPLKAWRYVGVFGPEMMLCIGSVRVGPLRQSFWAVWDRAARQLHERTLTGRREVELSRGRAAVDAAGIHIELALEETAGVETVSRSGRSYAWTRKQGGVAARGTVVIGAERREIQAAAVIDDTAAYYERHTSWRWCAGAGRTVDGRAVAWNLVEGVHDSPSRSERTLWIDGEPREVAPGSFDPDLRGVDGLRFEPEATRQRRENLLLVRSVYRQPFGRFRGELPGGLLLDWGYGVMEAHEAWW